MKEARAFIDFFSHILSYTTLTPSVMISSVIFQFEAKKSES